MVKVMDEGKYTLETFCKKRNLTRQSALNLLSLLKKKGYVTVSGGGTQKRIYTVFKLSVVKTNGFYDVVNKYSKEKLVPKFDHIVFGKYSIERAIIDGLEIGDVRTLNATMSLFNHVKDWKLLFLLADKKNLRKKVLNLYNKTKGLMKCRRIPERYLN